MNVWKEFGQSCGAILFGHHKNHSCAFLEAVVNGVCTAQLKRPESACKLLAVV